MRKKYSVSILKTLLVGAFVTLSSSQSQAMTHAEFKDRVAHFRERIGIYNLQTAGFLNGTLEEFDDWNFHLTFVKWTPELESMIKLWGIHEVAYAQASAGDKVWLEILKETLISSYKKRVRSLAKNELLRRSTQINNTRRVRINTRNGHSRSVVIIVEEPIAMDSD